MLGIRCCRSNLRRLWVAGSATVVVWAPLALAQPLPEDSATRLAARQLAQEGGELFDAGRFAEAQGRLRRAHALYPAPSIAVLEARALVELGRLVDAADRYKVAGRFELAEDSPEAFGEAVLEANAELGNLRKRIAQLVVLIEGASRNTTGLQVLVDGEPMPLDLVGMERPTDPGQHQIVASLPSGVQDTLSVALAEGEQKTVELVLTQPETPAAALLPPPDPAPAPVVSDVRTGDASTRRTLGWASLGLGGAGLTLGATAGLIMLSKKSALDDNCAAEGDRVVCDKGMRDDLDAYRAAKTLSWIGYGVGFAGIGAGAFLLLTATDPPMQGEIARISPWVGLGEVGVSGRF